MKNQNSKNQGEKKVEKSTRYIDAFRRNIDEQMEMAGYTIKETAEIADISFDTLKTFLYDKEAKDCRLSTAVKLARAFGVSIDELVGAGTIETRALENLKIYRTLPDGSKSLIDWHVKNQKFIREKHRTERIISVMKPLCACNGNLKITSDYEELEVDNLGDELFHKVYIGIKIPCAHYIPHYTQGEILLLANDRDALPGENTVIVVNGNIIITKRVVENGIARYYGIRDGKFRSVETDNIEILGYIVKVLEE